MEICYSIKKKEILVTNIFRRLQNFPILGLYTINILDIVFTVDDKYLQSFLFCLVKLTTSLEFNAKKK